MDETVLSATEAWRSTFPGAVVGALVMRGVRNPEQNLSLDATKRRLEADLRASGSDLGSEETHRILRAYEDYYRSRGKSFPLKAQRESIALKGKQIPSRAALVEAMFTAELKNMILTAGHDLNALVLPIHVDVSREDEAYVLMNGKEQIPTPGDMRMADGDGIISTVLFGPDRRTAITPRTTDALFAAYAPAGVGEESVRDHLEDIRANALLVAVAAQTGALLTVVAP